MSLTRYPELPPTPEVLRTQPGWWRRLLTDPAQARALWASADRLPLTGLAVTRGGAELVEVTFLAEGAPGTEWMVHLNTLTDRRRETLLPFRLERVPGAELLGGTFLLPADGVFSYRLTDITGLPDDTGRDRPGWREVHSRGGPDPRNPQRLPTPLGGDASVWAGPAAPWGGWPTSETVDWTQTTRDGVAVRVLPGDERVVVCFDAEHWDGLCLGAAARAAGLHTLVQVGPGASTSGPPL
ncbi:MAG: DUF3327 domain-containing protein [Actinomycetia bacterium]|nr:DUF3327 domain-containing protein [Actinomycetes bacterium]